MTIHHRDPNRPTPGASHPDPEPRHTGSAGRGDAPHDGYTVIGRRPRVYGHGDTMPVEEADRIEEMYRDFGPVPRPYGY